MAGPSRNKLTRLTPQHLIEQQLRAIGVPSILDTRFDALTVRSGSCCGDFPRLAL
jgi:hypothetical protein